VTFGVSTGVDSFVNPSELGPLYPFVGAEWFFVVIAFLLWFLWHMGQIRAETREENEGCELYDQIGLDRAMHHGGSALIATEEEWAQVRPAGRPAPPPPGSTGTPPPTV
jgi:hypothetical protein